MPKSSIVRFLFLVTGCLLVVIIALNLYRRYHSYQEEQEELQLAHILYKGDANILSHMLAHGLKVDHTLKRPGVRGKSLFGLAIAYNNTDCAKLLLDRGANIPVGATYLAIAAADKPWGGRGYSQSHGLGHHVTGAVIVGMLLERGLSLQKGYFMGKTPLHTAAEANSPETAAVLLSHGADINRVDDFGQTPLSYAVSSGSVQMVDFLLRNGAKINSCAIAIGGVHPYHISVLQYARQSHPELVPLLTHFSAKNKH